MSPLGLAGVVALVGLFTAGWVGYFRWKDGARPEPLWLMAIAVGGGLASALLALAGYLGLETLGVATRWEMLEGPFASAVATAVRIGAVEEVAKALPVLPLALLRRHFDELLDGVVYAACSAIGFAAAEGLYLSLSGELPFLAAGARAAAAPVTQALLSASWGVGLAFGTLRRIRWAFPVGLLAAIGAHAAYNLLLARPESSRVAAAALILALWVAVILLTPRLARLDATGTSPPVPLS